MIFSKEEILLAPLAGYTDLPFRRVCRNQGLRYAYTALIDAGALVYGNRENPAILKRGDDEEWLGVQLLGSRLDFLEKAAPMLEAMEYDEFNFNMGCPVRKVMQRNAGAALLDVPEHALACIRLLRKLVKRPFTVKMRILSEDDVEATVEFCRQLESAGVDGLIIHGRMAARVYSGPVKIDVISAVREAVRIPVVANGGIFKLEDAVSLREGTGCERVMVARGAIGNPWIFRSLLSGGEYVPSRKEVLDVMAGHVSDMMELYGEEPGLVNARKIILGYMGGRGYFKRSLKLDVCKIRTSTQWHDFLEKLADT
ncbi:MAG: tRNA-dihydrouridine synthase family protein [Victivallales bacterium]|nr:tRNA-dihydrouridine synthase family protein [Victivallales bacterium]